MEGVELTQFADVYRGRRVLVTGHTGFKGSWLTLWLNELGAKVSGVSLSDLTSPNHWDLLRLRIPDHRVDIRDREAIARVVRETNPEVIFHLAAQSLVRRSYRDPLQTWSTNVMGTVNVLDACRSVTGIRAIVVVTSDKCYQNRDEGKSYAETDRLGGSDPYSASKAGAEIVAASYRHAFFGAENSPLVTTARAGNVIGGGDWSEDRLIPDLIRAVTTGSELEIRSPGATRPWQHVLESLSGYLLLGQKLLSGNRAYEGAWNFGPRREDSCTVAEVLTRMRSFWPMLTWRATERPQPPETLLLSLDSSKAKRDLRWQPVWSLDDALRATAQWYRLHLEAHRSDSRVQLQQYVKNARDAGLAWAAA